MSTHVDSVTLAKRGGDNAVELQVFHVQVTPPLFRAFSVVPLVCFFALLFLLVCLRRGPGRTREKAGEKMG